jgi:hypothetical protein
MKIHTKDFRAVFKMHSKDSWGAEISIHIYDNKGTLVFADSLDYSTHGRNGNEFIFAGLEQLLNIQRKKDKIDENNKGTNR